MSEFIVLGKYPSLGWHVIRESSVGVDFTTADRIRNYYIEVKGRLSESIRVVELAETAKAV